MSSRFKFHLSISTGIVFPHATSSSEMFTSILIRGGLKPEFGLHLKILAFGVFAYAGAGAGAGASGYLYAFLGLCAYYASGGDAAGDVVLDVADDVADVVYVDAYALSYHD